MVYNTRRSYYLCIDMVEIETNWVDDEMLSVYVCVMLCLSLCCMHIVMHLRMVKATISRGSQTHLRVK